MYMYMSCSCFLGRAARRGALPPWYAKTHSLSVGATHHTHSAAMSVEWQASLASPDSYTALRRESEARLTATRAACAWERVPRPTVDDRFSDRGFTVQRLESEESEWLDDDSVGIERCAHDGSTVLGDRSAMWHMVRIGPFSTRGGPSRMDMKDLPLLDVTCLWPGAALVEFSSGIRGVDGVLLEMPAWHVHHINTRSSMDGFYSLLSSMMISFWGSTDDPDVNNQGGDPMRDHSRFAGGPFVEAGDFECAADLHCGAGTFHHRFIQPPYAYLLRAEQFKKELVMSVIEDLRPRGSPPVVWYLEFAMLRLAEPRNSLPAIKPTFGLQPTTAMPEYNGPKPSGDPWDVSDHNNFGIYHHPKGRASVNWLSFQWQFNVRLLESRVHFHHVGQETWLVGGTPETAGLSRLLQSSEDAGLLSNWSSDRVQADFYFDVGVPLVGSTRDAMKSIEAHVFRSGGSAIILCRYAAASELVEQAGPGGSRRRVTFNLSAHVACDQKHLAFRKNEFLTIVAWSAKSECEDKEWCKKTHALWMPWLGITPEPGNERFFWKTVSSPYANGTDRTLPRCETIAAGASASEYTGGLQFRRALADNVAPWVLGLLVVASLASPLRRSSRSPHFTALTNKPEERKMRKLWAPRRLFSNLFERREVRVVAVVDAITDAE